MAAHAGEMISELTLAITNQVPLEALAGGVVMSCFPGLTFFGPLS